MKSDFRYLPQSHPDKLRSVCQRPAAKSPDAPPASASSSFSYILSLSAAAFPLPFHGTLCSSHSSTVSGRKITDLQIPHRSDKCTHPLVFAASLFQALPGSFRTAKAQAPAASHLLDALRRSSHPHPASGRPYFCRYPDFRPDFPRDILPPTGADF